MGLPTAVLVTCTSRKAQDAEQLGKASKPPASRELKSTQSCGVCVGNVSLILHLDRPNELPTLSLRDACLYRGMTDAGRKHHDVGCQLFKSWSNLNHSRPLILLRFFLTEDVRYKNGFGWLRWGRCCQRI